MQTYQKGKQSVLLTARCLRSRGLILHELAHLVGLYHEHQRPDRDQYIEILYDNVPPYFHFLFTKYDYDTHGIEYDFSSIMHYPLNAFAPQDQLQTMTIQILSNVTPSGPVGNIGQRHSLSKTDFKKVNVMYSCPVGKEQLKRGIYK